jgi:hypothetical protein
MHLFFIFLTFFTARAHAELEDEMKDLRCSDHVQLHITVAPRAIVLSDGVCYEPYKPELPDAFLTHLIDARCLHKNCDAYRAKKQICITPIAHAAGNPAWDYCKLYGGKPINVAASKPGHKPQVVDICYFASDRSFYDSGLMFSAAGRQMEERKKFYRNGYGECPGAWPLPEGGASQDGAQSRSTGTAASLERQKDLKRSPASPSSTGSR